MGPRRLGLAALVAASLAPAGSAVAAPDTFDLLRGTQTIVGVHKDDALGATLGRAGDVNGDGVEDFFVGAPAASPRGVRTAGEVVVVFGTSPLSRVDLTRPIRGFRIQGTTVNDRLGRSVAALGDTDGDGLDDLAVGVPLQDFTDRRNAGAVLIVRGKRDGATVRSTRMGGGGWTIRGAGRRWLTGISVAPAGDVNGDGLADVLLGADGAGALDPPSDGQRPAPVADATRQATGAAYVVFGGRSAVDADLVSLGSRGYALSGALRGDLTGAVVALAGDVNGDGTPDHLVGAPSASPRGRDQAGRAYVLYGRRDGSSLDLGQLGYADGYAIDGARPLDRLAGNGGWGSGLVSVGDVDLDGVADIAVSAWVADPLGRPDAGSVWVVPGVATADVDLADPAAALMTVHGARPREYAGRALAPAGDVDGDGRADVAIGAPGDLNEHHRPGVAFVALAAAGPAPVDLGARDGRALRLVGGTEDRTGSALAPGPGGTLMVGRPAVQRGRTGYNAGAVTFGRLVPGPIRRVGTRSNELFEGGSGADVVRAGNGLDRVRGFGGNDVLRGEQGADVLDGGEGDDRLYGGDGTDRLNGGPGNDVIDAADDFLRDVVDCGPGVDVARVGRRDRVRGCERVTRVRGR